MSGCATSADLPRCGCEDALVLPKTDMTSSTGVSLAAPVHLHSHIDVQLQLQQLNGFKETR